MAIQKRATTVPLFFPPLFLPSFCYIREQGCQLLCGTFPLLRASCYQTCWRTQGQPISRISRQQSSGERRRGGGPFVSHMKHEKAYTKDQRNMHDHIADGVFGKLHCRLLFFPPPILLSPDCFTFLSHKSPDVLSPGSRPNNEAEEGGVSASQDRRHDCIFHMGSALRALQPFFSFSAAALQSSIRITIMTN